VDFSVRLLFLFVPGDHYPMNAMTKNIVVLLGFCTTSSFAGTLSNRPTIVVKTKKSIF